MKKISIILMISLVLALVGCAQEKAEQPESVKESKLSEKNTKKVEGFGGVIAKKYADSKEWWPPEIRPPEGVPNVIIFLLDDVGFSHVGSFGGLIETPNIDKLAKDGLLFNNAYTPAAMCAPARSATFSGMYPARRFTFSGSLVASKPHTRAVPPDGSVSPSNIRMVVVFPAPLGPSRPNTSFSPMRRLRWSTTVVPLYVLVKSLASTTISSAICLPSAESHNDEG